MQKNITKIILSTVLALFLLSGTFSGGLITGWILSGRSSTPMISTSESNQTNPQRNTNPSDNVTPRPAAPQVDLDQLFTPFWEAWAIINSQYVDQPVVHEKLMRGAIQGMLQSLGDPHTAYMDPNQYKQQTSALQGEYEGIGAWVDISGEFLKITSPMPGSPAEKAGLKPKDTVIAVNDEDMSGLDGNIVLSRILGPAGTLVKLTILRDGETKPLKFEIKRSKIIVPSIESKMLDGKIGYIRLFTFGEKTTEELRSNLKSLMDQKPVGLIIDLRNNGGGYLPVAIETTSQFIGDNKVLMVEKFGDGNQRIYRSQRGGLATEIPLVVLVNKGSASASEIMAGAIQDYKRGKLIGTTSYGKGSVQNWIPLKNDQGAVRVTIARWLTPMERPIDKIGLKPDIEVLISEEDIKVERDSQLERAKKYFTSGE